MLDRDSLEALQLKDAHSYRDKYRSCFYELERQRDYLEWLFQYGDMNHTTLYESWEEFEKWEDSKTKTQ